MERHPIFAVVGGQGDLPPPASVNWQLAASLLPAMVEGVDLQLAGLVSSRLMANTAFLQAVFSRWLSVRPIRILAQGVRTSQYSAATSAFFSGGVDSWFTLLAHGAEIDNLILVHGFDISLANTALFRSARDVVERAASDWGKRLIVLRTDLREVHTRPYWSFLHGSALAAAAHFLERAHRRVLLAATYTFDKGPPWGSHPLTDPYWSSDSVEIVHTDGDTPRIDKLRVIAQHPDIARALRVCGESKQINCGFCEKCVRTRLGLLALGVDSTGFPGTLSARHVRQQRLSTGAAIYWRELAGAGLPPSLDRAVKQALRDHELRLPPPDGTLWGRTRRAYHAVRWALRYIAEALH